MNFSNLRKCMALTLAMVLLAALFAGCGGGEIGGGSDAPAADTTESTGETGDDNETGGDAPEAGGMFQIALTAPFTGFDPLRTNDSASTYINAQVYETLYRVDPVGGGYICLLAEELPEFNEDGTSCTIKLREGVSFHDGTPFNAEAVKYTIELIKDPDFGSLRASIAASIDEVEIIDDYNIRLHLNYEDGVITAKLAHTNSAIVSPTAQQAQDLMIDPVGTGPYRFVSSVSGSDVVLTANEEYWGGAPTIKDVTMTIIQEESTAIARMETGEAHFIPQISVEQISRVEAMSHVNFGRSDGAQIYYMGIRANSYVNPIMANQEFRTALMKAIDVDGYVEYVLNGYATPAHSIVGPKIFGYDPSCEEAGIAYDPEGAKELIETNGWADEEILFLVPSTPAYTPLGEYIQSQLSSAGFTNVQIEAIDWSAWLTESQSEDRFDITVGAWSNVTRDGTELLEPNWHSVNSSLRYFCNDTELDGLIEASKTTSVEADRIANIQAANELIMQKGYALPIFNNDNLFCYNSAYQGVTRDPGGTFYLSDITYA